MRSIRVLRPVSDALTQWGPGGAPGCPCPGACVFRDVVFGGTSTGRCVSGPVSLSPSPQFLLPGAGPPGPPLSLLVSVSLSQFLGSAESFSPFFISAPNTKLHSNLLSCSRPGPLGTSTCSSGDERGLSAFSFFCSGTGSSSWSVLTSFQVKSSPEPLSPLGVPGSAEMGAHRPPVRQVLPWGPRAKGPHWEPQTTPLPAPPRSAGLCPSGPSPFSGRDRAHGPTASCVPDPHRPQSCPPVPAGEHRSRHPARGGSLPVQSSGRGLPHSPLPWVQLWCCFPAISGGRHGEERRVLSPTGPRASRILPGLGFRVPHRPDRSTGGTAPTGRVISPTHAEGPEAEGM